MTRAVDASPDEWSQWLLHRRHGDDPLRAAQLRSVIDGYVDRVLLRAALRPGDRLLDVGTGEGVVAFRAIEQVGTSLRVILSDVSEAMLRYAERDAKDLGIDGQCTFVHAAAHDLRALPDASVDVITTRSVLAYVADRSAALAEFHRVLVPGGRLSIAEPVMQDEALDTIVLGQTVAAGGRGADDGMLTLLHRWRAALFPDTPEASERNPITNYNERDLFRWVRHAGFVKLDLELKIRSTDSPGTPWDTFLRSSPHPWSRTAEDILRDDFSLVERQMLESLFRPGVESGRGEAIDRMVYLSAIKPVDSRIGIA